jgi:hypothetical protein
MRRGRAVPGGERTLEPRGDLVALEPREGPVGGRRLW